MPQDLDSGITAEELDASFKAVACEAPKKEADKKTEVKKTTKNTKTDS